MCVSAGRAALFDRAAFFGVISAAAAPFLLEGPGSIVEAATASKYGLPEIRGKLTPGNAHAARLAQASPFVRATYSSVEVMAHTISDGGIEANVVAFLHWPKPDYAGNATTPEARTAVRDKLAAAGFIKPDDPVSGIFPAGTEPDSPFGIQPFWGTPGSGEGSHHGYPGGLAVHEYFNASMAQNFAETYDAHYFGGKPNVDRDIVVGAALYHDIMKSVVFQWHDDGTIFSEMTIAGTGAHHILSGAEAIAHGRTARFVTTLLSAHAAPSLGDETKVTDWCRAAAIVAGVDPVAYGLVKPDAGGYKLAADPVPLEAFISNLSDHDYVLSVHAMHVVSDRLKLRYAQWQPPTTLGWYRAAVLSQTSAIALYDTLARHGETAFTTALQKAETNLSFS
jgi:hypothetical protein